MMAVLCAGLLIGCASRPGPELLTPVAQVSEARLIPVFVATTRTRQAPDVNAFTNDRSPSAQFRPLYDFGSAGPPPLLRSNGRPARPIRA